MGFETHVDDLPYAHGGPIGTGLLREQNEYFKVNESLTFEPSGDGEHVFLYIQKTALNTEDIVKRLAIHAELPRRSVSYAGMKDRHGVTKQWFSVHLPGKEGPDWYLLEDESLKIEHVTRHLKKLKRGTIKFNQFNIVVSQLNADKEQLADRSEQIKTFGVPNYFMDQRFGYLCQNIDRVYNLFSKGEAIKNKKMKSLLLSSARSFLFNKVLAERAADKNWDLAVEGDAFMLNGTRQFFKEDNISNEINKRLSEHDIHPTGPLFGQGEGAVASAVYELENNVFKENSIFCDGLIKERVDFSRRSLRVVPDDFKLDWLASDKLQLSFKLRSGSYATAVVRELLTIKNRFN
ncbi:tRNA pseudouridine synthase D [Cycloclasticus sp. 44_32_T64]|nr:tRNA pseudouridine synthase D [Cycloclasticus sp. 44_32_T64]